MMNGEGKGFAVMTDDYGEEVFDMMNGEGKGFAVMTDDYGEEGIVVLIRMNEDW